MVSASGPEAAFTVVARDRAIKVLDTISAKLGTTTAQMGRLAQAALRATAVFQGLAVALPIVIGLLSGLIAGATIPNMIEFAVASRRARIQLQFMGLDATNARAAVEAFSAALDRATATSLLQNADAVAGVAVAGADLAIALGLMAQELSTITGLDVTEVFNALIQARLFDNIEPLLKLVGGLNNLGISLGEIQKLTGTELIILLGEFLSAENVTHAEGLAAAFTRLSEITLPGREAISEFVTAFLLILVLSLEERILSVQDNFRTIILGALTGAMIFAGRGLGRQLAGGILIGLLTFFLLNFNSTIKTAFEDPLLLANIIAVAIILGKVSGRGFVAGIVLAIAVALLPGLKAEFDRLATSDQISVSVFLLGTVMALAFRQRFITALALGSVLAEIAKGITSGKEGSEARLGFGAAGATIGAFFGAGLIGAVVGFFIGTTLFDIIEDTGWFRGIEFAISLINTLFENAVVTVARFTIIGINKLLDGVSIVINEFIGTINIIINALNRINPLGNIPLLDPIDIADIPTDRFLPIPLPEGVRPPRNQGGSQPGFGGFGGNGPRQGITEDQGIFRGISNLELSSQPLIIQLVLDRKVIEEVSINALRREIRFKSGLSPGSIVGTNG